MKKMIFIALGASFSLLTACGGEAKKEDVAVEKVIYTIDSSSTLGWKGTKFGSADFHVGTIKLTEGTMVFEGDKFVEGAFVADMNTIMDTDLPQPLKDTLHKHLASPQWFDIVKFPVVKITVTGVSDKEIMATLNILGKDVMATMPVMQTRTADAYMAKGTFDIDMKDLMVPGMAKVEGQKEGVNTIVTFDLNLSMKK